MVVCKKIIFDVKTGKESIVEEDISPPVATPEAKGIDIVKLKSILKAKGIITDESEIE